MTAPHMVHSEIPEAVNGISRAVIGAAIEVHRVLGPGLFETVYQEALADELRQRGLKFEREVPLVVRYKGRPLGIGFRADFVVERTVVIELKAVEAIHRMHEAQLLTYLNGSGFVLGLLFNFHAPRLMPGGFRRFVGRSAFVS